LFITKKYECRDTAIPECVERGLTDVAHKVTPETCLKWGMEERDTKKPLRILVCSPVYTRTKLVKPQIHLGDI